MEQNIRKNLMVVFLISLAILGRFVIEYLFQVAWDYFDLSSVTGIIFRTITVIIFVIIWLSVTFRSDSPHQKLPWLLVLTFEPVLGITLFLTFGRSFRRSLRYRNRPLMVDDKYITREMKPGTLDGPLDTYDLRTQNLLKSAHRITRHQPFIDDSSVEVLKNGETFYPALIQSIKEAKHFILFQFFIIRSDKRGREIVDLLMQKAEDGVEVKMIMDGLGSARMKRRYRREIQRSAIDLVIQDKVYFPLFNTRIHYRNHRKNVVIDGLVAYTGGMNIGNEYDNRIPHDYYFRDTQLKIEGALVHSLTALFFKDYYYNTNQFIDSAYYYPAPKQVSEKGAYQLLESGPDHKEASIRDMVVKMIHAAQENIRIMTPYMALDPETLNALKTAATSGINVEIIVPGTPDKYVVYKVTKYFISNLMADGVNVYHYEKGFSHAKVIIIDDMYASVGSYNMDYRSAMVDFELSVLIASSDAVTTLIDDFEADKQDSILIDQERWDSRSLFNRVLESVMSYFTPII